LFRLLALFVLLRCADAAQLTVEVIHAQLAL